MTGAVPAPRRHPGGGDAGFTLIEVLVALAVLAAVLSSAFGVFSTGLRGLSRSDERLTLALFAESLLTRSGLDLARGADAEASGSTADGLSWQVRKVPYQLPKAEIDAAVEEAPVLPTDRERDATTATRFGRDDSGSSGAGSDEQQEQQAEGGSPTEGGTTDGGRDGPSGFGGTTRPSTAGGREAAGAPARPSLRLSQVQVVVQNARGESFTLTTLHVERAR